MDWFNNRRVLEPMGHFPPAEFEEAYYRRQVAPAMVAGLRIRRLRKNRGGSDIWAAREALTPRMAPGACSYNSSAHNLKLAAGLGARI